MKKPSLLLLHMKLLFPQCRAIRSRILFGKLTLRLTGVECFFGSHTSSDCSLMCAGIGEGSLPLMLARSVLEDESTTHLLIHCSVPRATWMCIDSLNITPDDCSSFHDLAIAEPTIKRINTQMLTKKKLAPSSRKMGCRTCYLD